LFGFLDSGMRLAGLANLRLEDLDLDQDVAIVVGKGRRPRACPFGGKTGQAIDRCLRMSPSPRRCEPWLWVGKRGRMNDSGVYQLIVRRAGQAGLDVHPHQLDTPPPRRGSALAAKRATSCVWPAGAPRRPTGSSAPRERVPDCLLRQTSSSDIWLSWHRSG